MARRLDADEAARAALDARLAATLARVVGDLRPALGGYVAGVIAAWQPDELITRFEAELGPDLQYIRINGAILGALIGGVPLRPRPASSAEAHARKNRAISAEASGPPASA